MRPRIIPTYQIHSPFTNFLGVRKKIFLTIKFPFYQYIYVSRFFNNIHMRKIITSLPNITYICQTIGKIPIYSPTIVGCEIWIFSTNNSWPLIITFLIDFKCVKDDWIESLDCGFYFFFISPQGCQTLIFCYTACMS